MTTLSIETPRVFLPLLKPARYKGAHGGRGSGKSHFFAEMLVEEHIRNPGMRSVCVREVQKSLRLSVKTLVEDKIRGMGLQNAFNLGKEEIGCPGGGLISFQGMQNHTSDSIKSLEGFRLAWVEEAQSLSQRSLDLLRPTLRSAGSELWLSWNPSLATDPVNALLRGSELPPDAAVIEVNYTDNPWFPEELRKEMEFDRKRDPDKYAHIWLGQYQKNSSTRVFRNWRIEEFDIDPNWTLRQGADWGFSIDPTCLVQCAIVGKTLYVPHEAYRVGCDIVDTPDLFMSVPGAERWPLTADSARPETISHMRKNGFPRIVAAVKGARSLEEGVEWLKSFDIVVHPRCKHLIDELTLYSYKVDPLTSQVLPILEDKDNHVIDALRYACEGARRAMAQAPAVARPVPTANRWR